jgi:sarcosine oxidase
MKCDFEYIVIGCGGIGSAALYWLSRRAGKAVLGLEQFELFHTRGASQDYSRIIRLYYHDNKYVPLTPHSYTAWATVEAESGVRVVTKTGGVVIADCNSPHHAALDVYEDSLKQLGGAFQAFAHLGRSKPCIKPIPALPTPARATPRILRWRG